jgi:diacylglycerol O-acyltransferase / wax synthase
MSLLGATALAEVRRRLALRAKSALDHRMGNKRLGVMDTMFLAAEGRESMMHVGGMLLLTPPPDAPPTWLRALTDELRAARIQPPWNVRLRSPELLKSPLQWWVDDERFDIDYHVRRSALPSPGDERELGVLVSRLHSVQLDFHHPPWEVHFIEGLEGGRFALYFKIHHALLDGYTSMRMLASSLSTDPDERDTPMFFTRPPSERYRDRPPAPSLAGLFDLMRGQADVTRDVGRAIAKVVRAVRDHDHDLVAPLQAPRSILNRRISRNRRFATQQLPTERLRALGKRAGGTVNDVILALCGAALRRLLLDLDVLPDHPLIALLPVNIRPHDDPGGGNALGAILSSLGTEIEDPAERLAAIIASTTRAKEQLRGMSRRAIMQYTALLMTPLALQLATGTAGRTRPTFNVVISNLPGPSEALYFRGARLEGLYPLSIPFHGYALNITISGYIDSLNFGFTGCRDTVPHLQRIAVYSAAALDELEAATAAIDN